MCFNYPDLLYPPTLRAAYSDRMAWLLAEMSRLSYIEFEKSEEKLTELKTKLNKADFELVQIFNKDDTQAFLAKRDKDHIATLIFRGTEIKKWRDIFSDLDFRFFKSTNGAKIHNGFQKAFEKVKEAIEKEFDILKSQKFSIYIGGHSLGGAIALVAARHFSDDSIASCYTFGSPRVGNSKFGDTIKPPVYRVVNANDIVPRVPFPFIITVINWWAHYKKNNILIYLFSEKGTYTHHGDQRYLTPCKKDFSNLRLISNPSLNDSLYRYISSLRIGLGIKDHGYDNYCEKLAHYAKERKRIK